LPADAVLISYLVNENQILAYKPTVRSRRTI
jgi:hypothetical protein